MVARADQRLQRRNVGGFRGTTGVGDHEPDGTNSPPGPLHNGGLQADTGHSAVDKADGGFAPNGHVLLLVDLAGEHAEAA